MPKPAVILKGCRHTETKKVTEYTGHVVERCVKCETIISVNGVKR
jgi:hypothetical protein